MGALTDFLYKLGRIPGLGFFRDIASKIGSTRYRANAMKNEAKSVKRDVDNLKK